MKIITLMEDTFGHNECAYEHGLSLYIETKKHHILFDTGASIKTLENAEKLGVDLKKVDIVVLSHGHYDHAGAILEFAKINSHAVIYMRENVDNDYYHGNKYIGIDKDIMNLPQICLLKDDYQIDDELFIFTHIGGRRLFAKSNLELSKRIAGRDVQDTFEHEQCLVVFQENETVLLSGCAHNGILNILDKYHELLNDHPQIVISGFHMNKKNTYTLQDIEDIKNTAKELHKMNTVFYTGHCTGQEAYNIMKDIMYDQLIYIHSGYRIL